MKKKNSKATKSTTTKNQFKAGQPKKLDGKMEAVRVPILSDWKIEDTEEAKRLGIVSERSETPKLAELYRRMRQLWYQTPKRVRDKIDAI